MCLELSLIPGHLNVNGSLVGRLLLNSRLSKSGVLWSNDLLQWAVHVALKLQNPVSIILIGNLFLSKVSNLSVGNTVAALSVTELLQSILSVTERGAVEGCIS